MTTSKNIKSIVLTPDGSSHIEGRGRRDLRHHGSLACSSNIEGIGDEIETIKGMALAPAPFTNIEGTGDDTKDIKGKVLAPAGFANIESIDDDVKYMTGKASATACLSRRVTACWRQVQLAAQHWLPSLDSPLA